MASIFKWKNCEGVSGNLISETLERIRYANATAAVYSSDPSGLLPNSTPTPLDFSAPRIDISNATWGELEESATNTLDGTFSYQIVPIDTLTGRIGEAIDLPPLTLSSGQKSTLQIDFSSKPASNVSTFIVRDGIQIGEARDALSVSLSLFGISDLPTGFYTSVPPIGTNILNNQISILGLGGPPVNPLDALWLGAGIPPLDVLPPYVVGMTFGIPSGPVIAGAFLSYSGVVQFLPIIPIIPILPYSLALPIPFKNLGGPITKGKIVTSLNIELSFFFEENGESTARHIEINTTATAAKNSIDKSLKKSSNSGDGIDDFLAVLRGSRDISIGDSIARNTRGLVAVPQGSLRPYLINMSDDTTLMELEAPRSIVASVGGYVPTFTDVITDVTSTGVSVGVYAQEVVELPPINCPPNQPSIFTTKRVFQRKATRERPLLDSESGVVYWENNQQRYKSATKQKLRLLGLTEAEISEAALLKPLGRITEAINAANPNGASIGGLITPPDLSPSPIDLLSILTIEFNAEQLGEILDNTNILTISISPLTTIQVEILLRDMTPDPVITQPDGSVDLILGALSLLLSMRDIKSTFGVAIAQADDITQGVDLIINEYFTSLQLALNKVREKATSIGVSASMDISTLYANQVNLSGFLGCSSKNNDNSDDFDEVISQLKGAVSSILDLRVYLKSLESTLSGFMGALCIPKSVINDLLASSGATDKLSELGCSLSVNASVSLPPLTQATLSQYLDALDTIDLILSRSMSTIRRLTAFLGSLTQTPEESVMASANGGCSGSDLKELITSTITQANNV